MENQKLLHGEGDENSKNLKRKTIY